MGHRKSVYEESAHSKRATANEVCRRGLWRGESGGKACRAWVCVRMRSVWTRAVFSFGEGRKSAAFRPQKTAAKNACVRCRILQEWDSQVTALTELQFLEGPLRRVFFF